MIAFKMLGREFYFELWCPVRDTKQWDFGWEYYHDEYDTGLYWFGPFHGAICKDVEQPVLQ